MKMAKEARANGYKLATVGFSKRYSIYYYYGDEVNFIVGDEYDVLDELFKDEKMRVIVRKDEMKILKQQQKDFSIVEKGRKYILLKGKH